MFNIYFYSGCEKRLQVPHLTNVFTSKLNYCSNVDVVIYNAPNVTEYLPVGSTPPYFSHTICGAGDP